MHYVRSILVCLLLLHSFLASAGDKAWRFGGSGSEYDNRMACDSAGNIYVVGNFNGTISWGSVGGDSVNSAGNDDVYVVKLTREGAFRWRRTFGGTGNEYVNGIVVDAAGNVCITGSFTSSSINFGGGSRSRVGNNDLFVVKLDTNGNRVWDYTKGGVSAWTYGYGIGVNSLGQVFVSGTFTGGPVDFGGGTRSISGTWDIFVVKLSNSTGAWLVDYTRGGTLAEIWPEEAALKLDASGNVFIGGTVLSLSTGTFNFGGGARTVSTTNRQLFILKLDSILTYKADYVLVSGTGSSSVNGIAVDTSGMVLATGSFDNFARFGPGSGGASTSSGGRDMFVLKLNNALAYQWLYTRGSSVADEGYGIAVDISGNVYALGNTDGSINFGGSTLTSTGGSDVYIIKLNGATGAHMASGLMGGSGYDYGKSVSVSGNYVFVSGDYGSTTSIDFDPGPGTYSPGPARGVFDAFIVRLETNALTLPVRLLEFSARREAVAGALLDWSVAEDEGIAAYMIERSTDGSAFQQVAAVPAANSAEITHNYTFTDPSAPAGLVYYRLRIAAVDGSITYSPVRALQGTTEAVDNRVYPTVLQAGGNMHVRYSGEQPQLTLCDALGRVARLTTEPAGSGLLMCTIPAQLQPGVYTLSLSSSQGISSHRIVCR